jgi:fibro-slime domain-containing protein
MAERGIEDGENGTLRIVQATLGTAADGALDNKPLYFDPTCEPTLTPDDVDWDPDLKCTVTTYGAAEFAQWFVDTPGVNVTVVKELVLTRTGANQYEFDSRTQLIDGTEPATAPDGFFPIDELGLTGTSCGAGEINHNFHFTSEVRYWFEYDASTTPELMFSGDDDVWVYVNGHLALDIGGIHAREEKSFTIDATNAAAWGLEDGNIYEIVVFQAERNQCASNYWLTLGGFLVTSSTCGPECGDGFVTPNEQCDDGAENNTGEYGACNPDCTLGPRCGDGEVQSPPEECDDGINLGTYNSGQCAPGCVLAPSCGDGIPQTEFGEECDDGVNDGSYGGCTPNCQIGPRCGDGIINGNEECDDGVNDGTSCNPDCTVAGYCGDGIVQELLGEECDDGVNDGGYGECAPGCVIGPYCGDGVVTDPPETCDDGINDGSYGGCSSDCQIGPHCGDGVVNGNEQCDDGVNDGGYGECAPGCVLGPYCGDGIVNGEEDCDGTTGCNDFCLFEVVE